MVHKPNDPQITQRTQIEKPIEDERITDSLPGLHLYFQSVSSVDPLLPSGHSATRFSNRSRRAAQAFSPKGREVVVCVARFSRNRLPRYGESARAIAPASVSSAFARSSSSSPESARELASAAAPRSPTG